VINGYQIRNAVHGPRQGALIGRPRGVEVPMGSLLTVIAVTVAVNAPAAVEGAAVKVRTSRQSGQGLVQMGQFSFR
jgi:hypothetical protein